MHQAAAHDMPAEMLTDRLMAEAHAEQRLAGLRTGGDEIETDARLIGGAGPGRGSGKPCALLAIASAAP